MNEFTHMAAHGILICAGLLLMAGLFAVLVDKVIGRLIRSAKLHYTIVEYFMCRREFRAWKKNQGGQDES